MNLKYTTVNSCIVCKNQKNNLYLNNIIHTCGIANTLKIENSNSDIYICTNCNHYFLSPVIDEKCILEYYNILNSEYFNYSPTYSRREDDLKIVKQVQKIKSKGRVLEIGCGNGFFLKEFQELGYDCIGIEPSPKAAQFANTVNKLNVKHGFLDSKSFEVESFDIILLMDVIEHLYKPNELIELCNKFLKKRGILVILTGDIESKNAKLWKQKWFYLYSWEHISFFNEKSIRFLLEKNGFKIYNYFSIPHTGSNFYNTIRFNLLNPLMYIYNFWIKRKYKHISLCFDHMLVIAEKK